MVFSFRVDSKRAEYEDSGRGSNSSEPVQSNSYRNLSLASHSLRATLRGSSSQELALHDVLSQRRGALELGARLRGPAEFAQQIAANGRQQMVRLERWLGDERLREIEAGCWTERHPHGDRSVQLDDRRGRQLGDRVV